MEIEMTINERNLIIILHAFDFLRYEGYDIKDLHLYGRDHYLYYQKKWSNLRVYLEWAGENDLEVVISKGWLFFKKEFSLHKAFRMINGSTVEKCENPAIYVTMQDVAKYQSEFIQQHLMPVICGEMWIDELLKKKAKSS